MPAKTYVLDTNVLLVDSEAIYKFEDNDVRIPIVVLSELDNFKKEQSELGRNARQTARNLDALREQGNLSDGVRLPGGGTIKVELALSRILCRLPLGLDENVPDNQILAVAIECGGILVTRDINLRIKAAAVGVVAEDYKNNSVKVDEFYTGTGKGWISGSDLGRIYSDKKLDLKDVTLVDMEVPYPNQCITLYSMDNEKQAALTRYDSVMKEFVLLPADLKTLGLQPKNAEQQYALSLLLDPKINLVSLIGRAGSGKAQPMDALVLTPTGYVEMGTLKIGDSVLTPSGDLSKIIGVFPQGKKGIYKVSFSDGTSTECCKEHLWDVKDVYARDGHKDYFTTDLETISNKLVHRPHSSSPKRNYSIPLVSQCIDFAESDPLPVDPYLLGVLLGDGTFRSQPALSSADQFIVDECTELLRPLNCVLHKSSNPYDYKIISDNSINAGANGRELTVTYSDGSTKSFASAFYARQSGISANDLYPRRAEHKLPEDITSVEFGDYEDKSTNKLKQHIIDLGLWGKKSDDKFIPTTYLYTSAENRIKMIQGLMDTDGTVRGSTVEYYSTSRDLAYGFKFLVESIGGLVTLSIKDTHYKDKDGNKISCLPCYRLYLRLPPSVNPFRLPRKRDRYVPKTKYVPTKFIESVEYIGEKESQCILIDHPTHLYITNNFIVTHNTLLALAAALHGVLETKRFTKILLLKPIVSLDNEHKLGYMPGSLFEKLAPWLSSYFDNISFIMGEPTFEDEPLKKSKKKDAWEDKSQAKVSAAEELIALGLLECGSLETLRGRSLPNQCIIVDECQGLTNHAIKTIITRAGEGSSIFILGDVEQIDLPYLSAENNGLVYVCDRMKDQDIVGHITLTKSVRSELAELAAQLL